MRILVADSVYPQAIAQARAKTPDWGRLTGLEKVEVVLAERFGTWDSLGHAFRALGHEATDWLLGVASEADDDAMLLAPCDAVIVQDVGRRSAAFWQTLRATGTVLVGIVNHKHPGLDILAPFSLIATGFPHQVAEIVTGGVPCRYLPCAFDPRHLGLPADGGGFDPDEMVSAVALPWSARDLPVTFCGSLGFGNVWDTGTHSISAVAEKVPGFAWWGPKVGPLTDALVKTWRGAVYGRAYVEILGRSRLVLNRHGSTTLHHATNMRCFEATGLGACLLTDGTTNLGDLFVPWEEAVPFGNPAELVHHVQQLLGQPALAEKIAAAGQARTLKSHTYVRRAEILAEWIQEHRR